MMIPNTLGLSCEASQVLVLDKRDLLPVAQGLYDDRLGLRVLGGASNVILPAKLDEPLVLMRLTGIDLVDQDNHRVLVDVAAGEHWHRWVQTSIERGWPGLENLALIPGTVGAAPVQNIGAYGVEVAQRIQALHVWDFEAGKDRWLLPQECGFGYRDSIFKRTRGANLMVLAVRFALPLKWEPQLGYPDLGLLRERQDSGASRVEPIDVFNCVVQIRQSKLPDPELQPNVGSFFKNPVIDPQAADRLIRANPGAVTYAQSDGNVKVAAAWLIDQCGWKGMSRGSVGVHDRQALVIVNRANATAQEVLALAHDIALDVFERFGIELEQEPASWVDSTSSPSGT